MKVREVMRIDPSTVDERDDVAIALQIMLWNDYRHLPVMRGERLVGVLSERDVLASRRIQTPVQFGRLVSDAMTSPVTTVSQDEELEAAARLMADRKLGCLPVVEGDRLVGLITVTDMLRALGRREADERVGPFSRNG